MSICSNYTVVGLVDPRTVEIIAHRNMDRA